ncbi:SsrA-binding protein, partial [bacterium]|nr:SsrA-binding protein [bacterium]
MESKGIIIITSNKKAYHDYHIIDKIEAGLELKGT